MSLFCLFRVLKKRCEVPLRVGNLSKVLEEKPRVMLCHLLCLVSGDIAYLVSRNTRRKGRRYSRTHATNGT